MALFAYVWLLTNFARTEFVLSDLSKHATLEPNVYVSFGPYAYTGNAYFRNRVSERGSRDVEEDKLESFSSSKPVALWGYKFDTTSIAMRAFVELLGVTAFPPYDYYDRIHHYLLPQIFANPFWRTCQAVYYSPERLSALRNAHPDSTVDLLVIESIKDIAIQRGGITFVGKGGTDIVTLFRIQSCTAGEGCETVMLDDYRYEGESITTDIVKWDSIVYILRGAAQIYYWVRVCTLLCGCYAAAAAQADRPSQTDRTPRRSAFRIARRTLVMFFKIPSQCIVYGSSFPIMCYLVAHVIDSPIVYEIMGQKFESFNGLFQLSFAELITLSSIQMRNVWLLSGAVQLMVWLSTEQNWPAVDGVWGMPQFSIGIISSITIVSQFRYLSLRQTRATLILALRTMSSIHPAIDTMDYISGGGGKSIPGGVFLDMKAMACSVVILAVLGAVVTLALRVLISKSKVKIVFWRSYSVTPLSAGVMWPTTALAVSWSDDLFQTEKLDFAVWRQVLHLRSSVVKPEAPGPSSFTLHEQEQRIADHQLPKRPTDISTLDDRSEAVESAMYLMNITMLSDPLTYVLWRRNSSKTLVGYFRSTTTQRMYLVPLACTTSKRSALDWSNFELEQTAFADELPWSEIITKDKNGGCATPTHACCNEQVERGALLRVTIEQERRQRAATRIQSQARGFLARTHFARLLKRMRDRFRCANCGVIEPSGAYCKLCGRRRATFDLLLPSPRHGARFLRKRSGEESGVSCEAAAETARQLQVRLTPVRPSASPLNASRSTLPVPTHGPVVRVGGSSGVRAIPALEPLPMVLSPRHAAPSGGQRAMMKRPSDSRRQQLHCQATASSSSRSNQSEAHAPLPPALTRREPKTVAQTKLRAQALVTLQAHQQQQIREGGFAPALAQHVKRAGLAAGRSR
ncbi:hypothetical protein PybrP1_010477 [[Pythium] brassicae (nom. inval.)]|nr:hypothetical protein PybrP1_010477 [[Pythium] brassicae (nom. inval.)]